MAKLDPEKMAADVVAAAQGFLSRALGPLQEHVRGLIGRVDEHGAKLDSLERRASRHADHLAALESRLKKIEHGGSDQ